MPLTIRNAKKTDCPEILSLIKELATFEKLSDNVSATVQDLESNLFDKQYAEVLIAEEDMAVIGFALFFHSYSTFLGKPRLYLEDLYVKENQRGKGYGKKLLARLAQIAQQRGCEQMDWQVLDWNEASREFYHRLNANHQVGWLNYRLAGHDLTTLATESPAF